MRTVTSLSDLRSVRLSLAGTVGLIPALAGAAAAVGGLMQQMSGAFAAYAVGLFRHDGQVDLALMMLAWAACGLAAQFLLFRVVPRRAATRPRT